MLSVAFNAESFLSIMPICNDELLASFTFISYAHRWINLTFLYNKFIIFLAVRLSLKAETGFESSGMHPKKN